MPSPTLEQLALRYVRDRRARGELGRGTARQYESRLLDFATINIAATDVTRRHVDRWLERPGLRPHYRRSRLSTLRGFCKWCVLNGHMTKDPTLGVPLAPLPDLLPRNLASDESSALMDVARLDPRIRLAALFMLQEGLRRKEVAEIRIEDIDRARREVGVRGKGGHGGITRREPISHETWAALVAYLPIVAASSGPLLRSTRYPERGISPAWLGELVTRVMYEAGAKHYPKDGRSPHALRHTAAQDMIDMDVPMEVVQRVLGHKSIANTQLYVRASARGLRERMGTRTYEAQDHPAGRLLGLDEAG